MENQTNTNRIHPSFNPTNNKFLKNKLYFTLNYIACLIVGILIISVSMILFGLLSGVSITTFLIIIPIIFLVSLITYLSLGYFKLNKKRMLISTISLSLIVSMSSFGAYYLLQYLSTKILGGIDSAFEVAGLGDLGNLVDIFSFDIIGPIILSVLTIFLYILWPLIKSPKKM